MKEIRGMEAVRYAEEQGIIFDVDEDYMVRTENTIMGGENAGALQHLPTKPTD